MSKTLINILQIEHNNSQNVSTKVFLQHTINLENFEFSPFYSNQNPGLCCPARSIGTGVCANICSKPLSNLSADPEMGSSQGRGTHKEERRTETFSKRQQSREWSSHTIPSHYIVTPLGCFFLIKSPPATFPW